VIFSIFCIDNPIPVKCDSMAGAINTACELMKGGARVSRINGSDGFTMERRDIEIECIRREEGQRHVKT
jgi:hypothetical protein